MSAAPLALYELAAQVVPVLMIALFLDQRTMPARRRPGLGARIQRELYLGLSVSAFVVALLVVADVIPGTHLTAAIVIAALVGCVALLAVQARGRAARPAGSDRPG